jgi:hypothetical protein
MLRNCIVSLLLVAFSSAPVVGDPSSTASGKAMKLCTKMNELMVKSGLTSGESTEANAYFMKQCLPMYSVDTPYIDCILACLDQSIDSLDTCTLPCETKTPDALAVHVQALISGGFAKAAADFCDTINMSQGFNGQAKNLCIQALDKAFIDYNEELKNYKKPEGDDGTNLLLLCQKATLIAASISKEKEDEVDFLCQNAKTAEKLSDLNKLVASQDVAGFIMSCDFQLQMLSMYPEEKNATLISKIEQICYNEGLKTLVTNLLALENPCIPMISMMKDQLKNQAKLPPDVLALVKMLLEKCAVK